MSDETPPEIREFFSAAYATRRRARMLAAAPGPERLQAAFIAAPPSARIAESLAAAHAAVCAHGRRPCITRCGVRRGRLGRWEAIPSEERRAWLERMKARSISARLVAGDRA